MRLSVMLVCVAGTVLLQASERPATAEQPWRSPQAWRASYSATEPTPARRELAVSPKPSTAPSAAGEDLAYARAGVSANVPGVEAADATGWDPCCDDPCCSCCRCRRARMIGSTCDMPQHHPYHQPMHGYYYFRPYHHSHVATQQTFARMWGEDPANPYANRIFQTVYEQYRADAGVSQPPVPLQGTMPQPPLPEQPPVEQ